MGHHSGEGFQDVMSQYGAVLYSSQWVGWVPGHCGGDGNLGASSFSVSNLRIQASVEQGPEPTKCSSPEPAPTPPPTPVPPAPTPTPTPTPGPSPANCTTPVQCHGALRKAGNRIVDQNGKVV